MGNSIHAGTQAKSQPAKAKIKAKPKPNAAGVVKGRFIRDETGYGGKLKRRSVLGRIGNDFVGVKPASHTF